jgi:hypothetical protein
MRTASCTDQFQLLAYIVATGLPSGTLIYAADEGVSAAEHVVLGTGKRLSVIALDLSAPLAAIRLQIGVLADAIGKTLVQCHGEDVHGASRQSA